MLSKKTYFMNNIENLIIDIQFFILGLDAIYSDWKSFHILTYQLHKKVLAFNSAINLLHSSSDGNAPYEDFHEKYIIYKHEPFRNRSVSFEEKTEIINKDVEIPENRYARPIGYIKSLTCWQAAFLVGVPMCLFIFFIKISVYFFKKNFVCVICTMNTIITKHSNYCKYLCCLPSMLCLLLLSCCCISLFRKCINCFINNLLLIYFQYCKI